MGLKENQITKQIRDYLSIRKIFHWKNWAGLGSTPGVPDILGVLPNGRFLGIEVKTSKGKVSAHQQSFINAINDNGGLVFVARSVDDVILNLKEVKK